MKPWPPACLRIRQIAHTLSTNPFLPCSPIRPPICENKPLYFHIFSLSRLTAYPPCRLILTILILIFFFYRLNTKKINFSFFYFVGSSLYLFWNSFVRWFRQNVSLFKLKDHGDILCFTWDKFSFISVKYNLDSTSIQYPCHQLNHRIPYNVKKKKTSTSTDRHNTEKNLWDKRNIIDTPFCLEHWFLFIITILWDTKIGCRHVILEGNDWRDCCLPHFLCKNLFTKIKLDVHLKGLWSVWDGMGGGDLSWGFYICTWLVLYFLFLQFLILYLWDFPGFSLQLPPRTESQESGEVEFAWTSLWAEQSWAEQSCAERATFINRSQADFENSSWGTTIHRPFSHSSNFQALMWHMK